MKEKTFEASCILDCNRIFFSSFFYCLICSCFREEIDQAIITMRTDTNEISVHSFLANDINQLRETGKAQ